MKNRFEGSSANEGEEDAGITRRAFLRTLIAGGAATVVSGGCVGRERPIVFPEMQEDATWEKGIDRLRNAVFDLDVEANAIYTESKGKREWRYVKTEGRTTGGFRRDTVEALIRERPEVITFLHTHPIQVFLDLFSASELPRAKVEEVQNVRKTEASMVPSLTDVISAINAHEYFAEARTAIRHRVLDPSGIWSYAINIDHSFAAECACEARDSRAVEGWLDKDNSVRAVERGIPQRARSESTRVSTLWSVRERLSPEAREVVEKAEERARAFNDHIYEAYNLDAFAREGVNFAKNSFGGDRAAVDLDRMRMADLFKTLGVDLAFERYGEGMGK